MNEKKKQLKVLFIEEIKTAIEPVKNLLTGSFGDVEFKSAKTEKEFFKFVIRFHPDVIISAISLAKFSAKEALNQLRNEKYSIPFFVVDEKINKTLMNEFEQEGVEACISRPGLKMLPLLISKALDKKKINVEKEEAEHQLKNQEARLQTIFKNAPEAIINIGFKGEILEINPTGLNMLQLDVNRKLNRQGIFDFIHPDDVRRFKKFHNSAGIGNKKTEKFRLVGTKKGEHWVETSAVPLLNEDRHVVSVLTINRDITEQHKAQEKILYHARLFENITDAVISLDKEQRIISWNKGCEETYGWKEKEVMGRKFSDVLPMEFSSTDEKKATEQFYKDGHWKGELNFRHRTGSRLAILVSASLLKDEQGNVTGTVAIHRDITERKQAEQVIKENYYRLENAQEIAHMGYWDRDLVNNTRSWSKEMYKIFEKVPGDKKALEHFIEVVHPDDREELIRIQEILMGKDEKVSHRYRLQMKDGRIRHLLAFSQVLKDEKRVPYKLMGTVMDVTALEEAKAKAVNEERRFRELFENSPDGIYVEDVDGFILDVNEVACKFQGYSREELIGMNVIDLIPDSFKKDVHQGHEKFFNALETTRESFVWDKEWNPRPVELKTSRIRYDGKPALLLHVRDITDRKKTEKEKRESEIKFETLSAQAPVAIYHVDQAGKFLLVNKRFLEIFELTEEEAYSDAWQNCIHPDDRTWFMKLRDETIDTGKKLKIHYRLLVNGKVKYVFGKSNPLFNDEGKQAGRIGTILDLTENQKSIEQVRYTEAMFQNLFQHSPDPIFIEGMDGIILNANIKACLLHGMEYEQLVGKNILDLAPGNQHEMIRQQFSRLCEGTLHRLSTSVWNAEGKKIDVEIRANLINYFDKVALLLHVVPRA